VQFRVAAYVRTQDTLRTGRDGMNTPEDEAAGLVLDGGMDIIVLCRYGDRRLPVEAFLAQFDQGGRYYGIVQVPIPICVRNDVPMPRMWPERPMDYGVHSR
jgi:hypothetical protein